MKALVTYLSPRTLFPLLIALTVLLAPVIGRGEALAAGANYGMQTMDAGHCHSPASKDARHLQGGMSCCTALWIGVNAPVGKAAELIAVRASPEPIPVAALHRPFLAELATPPPRLA